MEVDEMKLDYDNSKHVLSVSWANELSVESAQFYQTIVSLFATIKEKQVSNLIIDSGIPAGGQLTEKIINFFIQSIPDTSLKNIAILESPDYLWDNNLYQVISLLITTYQLPIAVKLVSTHASGLKWIADPVRNEEI
jgi:hypothetical protein